MQRKNNLNSIENKNIWKSGDRVEFSDGESRIRGRILSIYPSYLLILTGYGYKTCAMRSEETRITKLKF